MLEVLADHFRRIGRPFGEIEKTVSTRLSRDESSESFARSLLALAEIGIEHAVVITDRPLAGADLATVEATAAAIRRG